jgi:O-antigen/teichoic acid export membrane protein
MRRFLFAFLASGLIQLAGLVTGLVSARLLGPTGRGELAAIVSVTLVTASLTAFSLAESTVYHLASTEDQQERSKIVSAALGLAVLLSGFGVATVLLVDHLLFDENRVLASAIMFAGMVPLYHLTMVLVAFFQVTGAAGSWSLLRALPQVGYAAGCVLYLATGMGQVPLDYLLAQLAANAALLLCAIVLLRRQRLRLRWPTVLLLRSLFIYGLRLHPSAVGQNARDHLDRLVLTILLPSAALGYYASSSTLAACLAVFGLTADLVVFPHLSRLSASTRRYRLVSVVRLGFITILAASGTIALLAPLIVPFLFGASYLPAVPITQVLCAAYGVASLKLLFASGLKASGRPLRASAPELAALVVMLILTPAFVLMVGPIGAAYSALTAQLLSGAVLVHLACGTLQLRATDFLRMSADEREFLGSAMGRLRGPRST